MLTAPAALVNQPPHRACIPASAPTARGSRTGGNPADGWTQPVSSCFLAAGRPGVLARVLGRIGDVLAQGTLQRLREGPRESTPILESSPPSRRRRVATETTAFVPGSPFFPFLHKQRSQPLSFRTYSAKSAPRQLSSSKRYGDSRAAQAMPRNSKRRNRGSSNVQLKCPGTQPNTRPFPFA